MTLPASADDVEELETRLLEATTIEELLELRAVALSTERFALTLSRFPDVGMRAYRVRVRAVRKLGQIILAAMAEGKTQGDMVRAVHGVTRSKVRYDYSRCAAVARIPDEDFEVYLDRGMGVREMAGIGYALGPAPLRFKTKAKLGLVADLVPNERGKHRSKGPTLRMSLRGLQECASQLQGLAEALEGKLLGEWSDLYGVAEADPYFETLGEYLPVLTAQIRRVLRERKGVRV